MKTSSAPPATVDAYIADCPVGVRESLERLRAAIREEAPDAVEKISYQMPTFFLGGNLVHFAACRRHIGFYPAPSGIARFQLELAPYKTSKGAVQLPLDQPLPLVLIRRIVRFRVQENLARAKARRR
jgi:uncharacterized protein YdhG (YjbR/CyaY superfamily)